jgi:hypothetical protein
MDYKTIIQLAEHGNIKNKDGQSANEDKQKLDKQK